MLKNIRRNSFFRTAASLKITVIALSILFILVIGGTLYQTEYGLYAAQKKFFYSWVFLVMGVIPFPGGQLMMWILAMNLSANILVRYVYKWYNIGILLIHLGLIILLAGSFITYRFAQESFLSLAEGDGSNVSADYFASELAVWEIKNESKRNILAFDQHLFITGNELACPEFNLTISIDKYYPNSLPLKDKNGQRGLLNSSGFTGITKRKPSYDPNKNAPGLELNIRTHSISQKILLHDFDEKATVFSLPDKRYAFSVRRKRYELPVLVTLLDFKKEEHPGTEIARNYESTVTIAYGDITRNVRIYMNNPLRIFNHTFYQSSYAVDKDGREISTFAIVKNSGRWLPYISSGLVFTGLIVHFIAMLVAHVTGTRARIR